ncbi:MAG: alpha/beta hydrolase [Chloroflexaceae bacterium]|nr:alpha/beta hydrolase [Chloroflexaceae bacterium]
MEHLEHHTTTVNGIQMHYVQTGSGPLLVLLHGFPEFWYSWRQQFAALSPHFTVVAPDLRGYNDTDKPANGYEIDVLASDVLALVRGLGYERAAIAGHDWGGVLAWHLGIFHSQHVERLVVLNLPHPALMRRAMVTNPLQMFRSIYMGLFQVPILPEALISANNFVNLERAMRGTAVNQSAFTDADIERYREALSKPGALTAALNWYRALGRSAFRTYNVPDSALHVTVPTLLIWGAGDPVLGVELTYGTEQFVNNLSIRYIKESGHWVHQEQPELVNRYLLEFLTNTL